MKLTRRDFVKLCSGGVAGLGISQIFHPGVLYAIQEGAKKAPVLWLEGQGCTGCSVTLLNSAHPSIASVLLDTINLEYHPTVMAAEGETALENLFKVAEKFKGKFFLAVEGSIPTAANGKFCTIGEMKDASGKYRDITMMDAVKELAPKALATVAIGTCASFGGIPASKGSVTGAKSVKEFYKEINVSSTVVHVPGCPPHPDWIVGTLVAAWMHVLDPTKNPMPKLDSDGRPNLFYGENTHENCEFLKFYDNSDFAKVFTERKCRANLGCKGPESSCDSFKRRWNNGANWCIENSVCIGCVESDFPDGKSPFYVGL